MMHTKVCVTGFFRPRRDCQGGRRMEKNAEIFDFGGFAKCGWGTSLKAVTIKWLKKARAKMWSEPRDECTKHFPPFNHLSRVDALIQFPLHTPSKARRANSFRPGSICAWRPPLNFVGTLSVASTYPKKRVENPISDDKNAVHVSGDVIMLSSRFPFGHLRIIWPAGLSYRPATMEIADLSPSRTGSAAQLCVLETCTAYTWVNETCGPKTAETAKSES